GLVDDRVDGRDAPVERGITERLAVDADRAADAHLFNRLLRNAEVHINRVQRLQWDDGIASAQVLPLVRLPNAENPGERRANRFSFDGGADLIDPCLRLT